jgi:hypothetical protein
MFKSLLPYRLAMAGIMLLLHIASNAVAHEIASPANKKANPAFDIVNTDIRIDRNNRWVEFTMEVSGRAGVVKPKAKGKFAGADVFSYVWPTKIDPYEAGFDRRAGILALAVTVHPDFDDTPLFATRGADWHTHWVVLGPDEACGPGMLKVRDIPPGSKPRLPKTWPGVPLLIDSPGYAARFAGSAVRVRVPFDNLDLILDTAFDGVTSGLRVNASAHAPLLCIATVFDVASGNLSLPGKASEANQNK